MLELLRARRSRLEMSLQLHKIFQEMIYVLDWMDEIKVRTLALECAVTSRLDCLVAPCQTLSAIDHDLSTASGCVLAVSCSPLLSVCSLQVISSFAIRSVASVSQSNLKQPVLSDSLFPTSRSHNVSCVTFCYANEYFMPVTPCNTAPRNVDVLLISTAAKHAPGVAYCSSFLSRV